MKLSILKKNRRSQLRDTIVGSTKILNKIKTRHCNEKGFFEAILDFI